MKKGYVAANKVVNYMTNKHIKKIISVFVLLILLSCFLPWVESSVVFRGIDFYYEIPILVILLILTFILLWNNGTWTKGLTSMILSCLCIIGILFFETYLLLNWYTLNLTSFDIRVGKTRYIYFNGYCPNNDYYIYKLYS